MPIQQMLLGVGAVAKKTYVDDVFSTYLYEGNNSTLAINNGLDLATEGGMIWVKNRDSARDHCIVDTERGIGKRIEPNKTDAQDVYVNTKNISSFTSTGFTLGQDEGHDEFNKNNDDYASWTFRKSPGFFDVVTYNGDSGAPNWGTSDISHNLGCIPGLIILKRTNNNGAWWVYHRDLPATTNAAWSKVLRLDNNGAEQNAYNLGTASYHTATTFRVGNDNQSNNTGDSYVAYLFAGGESTAATARSVVFDGSNDKVSIPDSTDFEFGSGDFTVEAWVKQSNSAGAGADSHTIVNKWDNTSNAKEWILRIDDGTGSNKLQWLQTTDGNSNQITTGSTVIHVGQWYHVAVVGHSGTIKLFVNGIQQASTATQGTINSYSNPLIFGYNESSNGQWMDGSISNCRIVKGTAVYTSSFKPPTEPLTNITNTKLLCLNNSSVIGSTVSPGTLTNDGATASTDSPFDDPAAFTFGDAGAQVIKTGSYVGNGDATNGTKIHLGFEPQWLLIKSTGFGEEWHMFDAMRGIVNGDDDMRLEASQDGSELTSVDFVSVHADGFTALYNPNVNKPNEHFVYVAIRRNDGYVGKPAEAGTDVFAMDTGNDSSSVPCFDSTFPVDFGLMRRPATSELWYTGARLMGKEYLRTDDTDAQNTSNSLLWDSNTGWWKNFNNAYQSWMWSRRGQSFDVVTYKGGQNTYGSLAASDISHNLGKIPEMIIIKRRNATENWPVYHKGFNNGSSPENYYAFLNLTGGNTYGFVWGQTAPTSTKFTVADGAWVNGSGSDYIAMLFASVSGISAVGSYTGTESSNAITTGFQPRFVFVKCTSTAASWVVWDTTRGVGNFLLLNDNNAQGSASVVTFTSTGFTLTGTSDSSNGSGEKYIYYAHA